MTLRDQWLDFITDPGRAGRHLTNLGTAVSATAGMPIDLAVLGDFLSRLPADEDDIGLIAGIVDLASGGYDYFCTRHLPPLLDSLSNEKIDELALVGPALRGNTRWDLTTLGRLSGRLLPTQFVTRLPHRNFALPENVLVRWLIEDLVRTIGWIERRVGSKGLLPQLAMIREGCEEALRHQWFREVPPPRSLGANMRLAAQRQRLPAYRHAAGLATRRQKYRDPNRMARWQHILDLLSVNWLAPVSDDDLFELYALVLVLDVLERDLKLNTPTQYGLAVPGRDHIALFEAETARVRVFFDQSPVTALDYPSYQLAIIAAHEGVRGSARRPDIVVVRDSDEGRRLVFIEVKKTADGAYISASVYKALGYLSDFRAIWTAGPSNPKIVVLFPEAIAPKATTVIADQEVILASSVDYTTVADALRVGLGL